MVSSHDSPPRFLHYHDNRCENGKRTRIQVRLGALPTINTLNHDEVEDTRDDNTAEFQPTSLIQETADVDGQQDTAEIESINHYSFFNVEPETSFNDESERISNTGVIRSLESNSRARLRVEMIHAHLGGQEQLTLFEYVKQPSSTSLYQYTSGGVLLPGEMLYALSKTKAGRNDLHSGLHFFGGIRERVCDSPDNTVLYNRDEWLSRYNLAFVHRVLDFHGWGATSLDLITVRIDENQSDSPHFLVKLRKQESNAEVTMSSFVRVDIDGNIVDQTFTDYKNGCLCDSIKRQFKLHSALYKRWMSKNLKCIVTFHDQYSSKIRVQNGCGILPLGPDGLCIYKRVSYNSLNAARRRLDSARFWSQSECAAIADNFHPDDSVALLEGIGIIGTGTSIEHAIARTVVTAKACKTQLRSLKLIGGEVDKLNNFFRDIPSVCGDNEEMKHLDNTFTLMLQKFCAKFPL